MRTFGVGLALAAAPLPTSAALAQDPPLPAESLRIWAQQFPDPARVNGDIARKGGGDALDIAARQRGTLYQLYGGLSKMSGAMINDPEGTILPPGRRPPPEVTAKRRAYWSAILANQEEWYPTLERNGCGDQPRSVCRRARYMDTSSELQSSRAYAQEVAERYFTPELAERYVAAVAPTQESAVSITSETERRTEANRIQLAVWIVAGAAALFLLLRWRGRRGEPEGSQASDNFGRADFAPLQTSPASGRASAEGVFLGQSSRPPENFMQPGGAPVYTEPARHTLIVAQTRTGKGTRVVVPTLLRLRSSALVIDPKGENAAVTARNRRNALGQQVHILNPWGVLEKAYRDRGFTAARYNPLDLLDRNDPRAVSRAEALAGAIVPVLAGSKAAVWEGNARDLLTAIFLWLTDEVGETKTLARAKELIGMSRSSFREQYLARMATSSAFGGAIREKCAQFIDLADETYSGVIFNLGNATNFITDPLIKAATATSDFSMHDLATTPTTVYVVIPTDMVEPQRSWLRLIISALTAAYKEFSDRAGRLGLSQRPCRAMLLIDELPALGRLADLPTDIATMAGMGIDYTLIVQGLGQLKAVYSEHAEAIQNNCAYKWFCNVGDLPTAEYLSKALGDKTVQTVSESTSTSRSPSGATSGTSSSTGETGRRLLKPEEILTLGADTAIALHPKGNAHYLIPVDYWNLEPEFANLRDRFPALLWDPPMIVDPNPYHHGP